MGRACRKYRSRQSRLGLPPAAGLRILFLSIVGCKPGPRSLSVASGRMPDEFVPAQIRPKLLIVRQNQSDRNTRASAPRDRCTGKKISLGEAPRHIERKISVTVKALLMAPARGFSTIAPLYQNHCRNYHDRRHHKTEWLQRISQPMKHEDIAQPHGDGRQNDDEK
jgi:hypothetical protein